MKQNEVVEKVIAELWERKIATRTFHYELRAYLAQVYAAGFDEGRRQGAHRKPVVKLTLGGNEIKIFDSVSIAAISVGVTKSSISKAALNKIKSAGGFKWKFENEI